MTVKQMIDRFKRMVRHSWRAFSAVGVILLAGALIEAISLAQYRYTHRLMETELDYRAESEMTLKSVRVRGMLKSNEKMLNNYLWPIQRQLNRPEAVYQILGRLVSTNSDLMSGFVACVPGYNHHQGELYEQAAIRRGDTVVTEQLAGLHHDYTQREFYRKAVVDSISRWTDPYLDAVGSGTQVVTYATPLTDNTGNIAGVFGVDLSTQGIIDTLNTSHNDPSTFFLLLTEDGRLISQPDSTHKQQGDVATVVRMINDSTCERRLSSTGHSKIITFENKDIGKGYAYYAFMKGKPHWQVVMVCYDNEVFSKLKILRRNFMLLMLGALSLLGFILYRFNRNVQRLHKSKLTKERVDSELRIAQNIQSEMIPSDSILRDDVDVCGKLITALEVGGDLFDYIR